ncbi:MAG: hypothetical protein KF795_14180 [Labilithrix sp.]|nr:hypothetical protein [Labilithrix sp.]
MVRSRTPSAQTLAVGSLLAGVVFLAVLASSTSTTGCSSQQTTEAPDAALPPCNQGPFSFFCEPPAPGQETCNTASNPSPFLARLPQNTDYPVGCVVNFVGARDEQGDCSLEAVCKCVIGEIPGPVTPLPEAGPPADGDAGDAGEADDDAGAPPAPAPGPRTGPVWICST